jgi:hypothetical protein
MWCNVASYEVSGDGPLKYEAHREYADVQIMFDGEENFGWANIKECNITEDFKVRQIIRNRIQWGDSLKFDYDNWPSLRGRNPCKKHMNISFSEKKPAWNNKYPMWVEHKPKPDTQLSLWDF